MAKGKLYAVSVGPGDPGNLTLRAAQVLGEVPCVAAPAGATTRRLALQIAGPYIKDKEIIDCESPMSRDAAETARAYDAIAGRLAAVLDEGRDIAFLTLGDASIYSSWAYLCPRMEERGFEVEVIPGVPSFCAAAAVLREPLCIGDEELLVLPAAGLAEMEGAPAAQTKVFMKAGRHVGELRRFLQEQGLAAKAALVADCGLESQQVLRGLEGDEGLPGYMSLVIARDDRNADERNADERNANERNADERDAGALAESDALGTKGPFQLSGREGAPECPPAIKLEGDVVKRSLPPQIKDLSFAEIDSMIEAPDEGARKACIARWNSIAKPIGGLGLLEDGIARIAAVQGSPDPKIAKRVLVVLCADNGVVAQGVSQCGSEVTRLVADALAQGSSSASHMARSVRADICVADIGMSTPAQSDRVLDVHIARGTGDISLGAAMSREQAVSAVKAGIGLAFALADAGYELIACGEMGIGNTTTAAAMAAALFGLDAAQVVGRGAGLGDAGLARKLAAVERALKVNAVDSDDVLDVLAKLGGFDIAGMAGLFIGAALKRLPALTDGLISSLAAFIAQRLCPACHGALIASHRSAEPAMAVLEGELGLAPVIDAGMKLGEGTGALCLLPLLDAAYALYGGSTFADAGIVPYEPDPA